MIIIIIVIIMIKKSNNNSNKDSKTKIFYLPFMNSLKVIEINIQLNNSRSSLQILLMSL